MRARDPSFPFLGGSNEVCPSSPAPLPSHMLLTRLDLLPACAVYVGISWSEYHRLCVAHGANMGPYAAQGAVLSVAPGRISYTFGLQVGRLAL